MSFAGKVSAEKNLAAPSAKKIIGQIIFAAVAEFFFHVKIIPTMPSNEQPASKNFNDAPEYSAVKIPADNAARKIFNS